MSGESEMSTLKSRVRHMLGLRAPEEQRAVEPNKGARRPLLLGAFSPDLASSYTHIRQVWQANVDFFIYLDEHAAHARYDNNRLLFDDPAEADAMRVLTQRILAADK